MCDRTAKSCTCMYFTEQGCSVLWRRRVVAFVYCFKGLHLSLGNCVSLHVFFRYVWGLGNGC